MIERPAIIIFGVLLHLLNNFLTVTLLVIRGFIRYGLNFKTN
mgnify:FL=1|jgi:uncharacterized membrane protein SirB2